MKKFILFLILLAIPVGFALSQEPDKWHTGKSTHFIVYYKNAPKDFIGRVIDKSEGYYDKIAEDLGFRRFDFWLWDDRAKIYIYDNPADYQLATGQPSWSGGCVLPKTKIIHTFTEAPGFLETVLPHEMGHIIFREFVGFDNYSIPLWLEEGVASYQEKIKYPQVNTLLRQAINQGSFMDLGKLSSFNLHFATNSDLIQLFYIEAFSIVNFLIKKYGRDNFVSFCQKLRDRKNLEGAIRSVYPFNNMQELDKAWQKWIISTI